MSTHGCFAPPFPPLLSSFWLLQPDGGVQEPDATFDDCYYPEGAYYHVAETVDDQE